VQSSTPRLMQLPEDGSAAKPEELEGLDITIVDCLATRMPDNRDSAKWVVRLPSGETKLYWAAGQNPMLQVRDWFRNNPGLPLYARLYRQVNQYGTAVWKIEQRDEDAPTGTTAKPSTEDQLTQAGL
jgi:hypothetical protein